MIGGWDKHYEFLTDIFGLNMLEEALYMRLVRRRVKKHEGTRLAVFRGATIGLAPGWLVTSERAIASELGAAKTNVRRALQRLEVLGLIRAQRCKRSGMLIFIAPVSEIPGLNHLENAKVDHVDNSASNGSHVAKYIDKNTQWTSADHQVDHRKGEITKRKFSIISDLKSTSGPPSGPPDNTNTQIKHTDTSGALKNWTKEAKFCPTSSHNISTTPRVVETVDKSNLHFRIEPVTHHDRFRAEYRYHSNWEKWLDSIQKKDGEEARLSALRATKQIRDKHHCKIADVMAAVEWLENNGCLDTGDRPKNFLGYLITFFPDLLKAAQKQEAAQKVRSIEEAKRAQRERTVSEEIAINAEKQNKFQALPRDQREALISLIRHQNPDKFPSSVLVGSPLETFLAASLWEPGRDYFANAFK